VSFRAWRGDLGGSATFLSPTDQEDSSGQASTSIPNYDGGAIGRMPTRDKSWSNDTHHFQPIPAPTMSSSLKSTWIPPPRSPVGRSRSSSMASASSHSSSALSGSLGTDLGGGHFFGGRAPPNKFSSSLSPPSMFDEEFSLSNAPMPTGVMISPLTSPLPMEGGGLVRTSTVYHPPPPTPSTPGSSALSASLRETSRLPTPPPINTVGLNGSLFDSENNSPPLFGSPPRRFHAESRENSLDGSNGSYRNSESLLVTQSGSGSGSRRVSVDGGLFDLSLEEGDFSTLAANSLASQSLMSKLQPLSQSGANSTPPTMTQSLVSGSPSRGAMTSAAIVPDLVSSVSPVTTPLKLEVKSSRSMDEGEGCAVRWHSAVFCAVSEDFVTFLFAHVYLYVLSIRV
jgi:hypothetical protein